jgi:hypothetical protein
MTPPQETTRPAEGGDGGGKAEARRQHGLPLLALATCLHRSNFFHLKLGQPTAYNIKTGRNQHRPDALFDKPKKKNDWPAPRRTARGDRDQEVVSKAATKWAITPRPNCFPGPRATHHYECV